MSYAHARLYFLLTIVTGILTYTLNLFNKISECSIIFTILAFTINITTEIFGKEKAIQSIILSVITSFVLMLNYNYYIGGRLIHGLIPASLIATLTSAYVGIHFLLALKKISGIYNNFYARVFVSLIAYAVTDGLVMAMFFINQFPLHKVMLIFYKEVLFKIEYSLILSISAYILHKAYAKYITAN